MQLDAIAHLEAIGSLELDSLFDAGACGKNIRGIVAHPQSRMAAFVQPFSRVGSVEQAVTPASALGRFPGPAPIEGEGVAQSTGTAHEAEAGGLVHKGKGAAAGLRRDDEAQSS